MCIYVYFKNIYDIFQIYNMYINKVAPISDPFLKRHIWTRFCLENKSCDLHGLDF